MSSAGEGTDFYDSKRVPKKRRLNLKRQKIKGGSQRPSYLTPALKKWPLGHLNRPIVTGFLPFGARVQVFVGVATSAPHFGHLGISSSPSL